MNNKFGFENIPQDMTLIKDNIDVWCVSIDVDESVLYSLMRTLSEEEREKARRMKIEKPRKYYMASRGLLRQILAAYVKQAPELLEFEYGPNGKPTLSEKFDNSGIKFNVSHSHGLALCCVTREREIGADIEKMRDDVEITDISKRFFSSREHEELIKLPVDDQKRGFYNCWTRKEAYLKATGQGLTFPLSQFDMSLTPGEPAVMIAHQSDPGQVSMWSIVDLDVGPDYAAAIAVEGKEFTISYNILPR